MRAVRYGLWLLLVTAIYYGGARLGLSQASIHANVSPVWPPTGIALVAVWRLGYAISPAVALGAFLVNLATGVSAPAAAGISLGNTLEALTAVFLLRRFIGPLLPFDRAHVVVKYVVITCGAATPISATIGNISLCFAGSAAWASFGPLWLTWWLGDAVGALIIPPLLLTWTDARSPGWTRRQCAEGVLLLAAVGSVSEVVFGSLLLPRFAGYPLEHLIIPFLLWAAFRFGPRGVAAALAVLSAIATSGTTLGFGPFSAHTPNASLLLLQVFVAAAAITSFFIAAVADERKHSELALRAKEKQLELTSGRVQRLNAELQRRVDEFQALIDTAPVGIGVAVDAECSHIWGNREFLNMLGAHQNQNVSKSGPAASTLPFRILRNGEELAPEDLTMQRACREGREVLDEELEIMRSDGSVIHELCCATPLRDEQGKVRGCIGVFLDITERKQADTEREQLLAGEQQARAEAEAANRVKDEFLAVMSHELRTPLNAILGWTHLLRSGRLEPDAAARALETVERNAKAQAQLVEDLLDISGIASGRLRLELKPIEFTAVIHAAVDSVRHLFEDKSIQLDITLDPQANLVRGDAARLQQVVWNLLSNAAKFTPKGGRIEIRLERKGASAELTVADDGEGIRLDFIPFVFDLFRQEDSSRARRHGGLGLGLAIVRRLTELHGGAATVYSAGENQGAAFTIRLPLILNAADAPDIAAAPMEIL